MPAPKLRSRLLALAAVGGVTVLLAAAPVPEEPVASRVQVLQGEAPNVDPVEGARGALERRARAVGVRGTVLSTFVIDGVHTLPRGTRVSLHAEVDGTPVLGTDAQVLLDAEGRAIAVTFDPAVRRMTLDRVGPGVLSSEDAVRRAFVDIGGPAVALTSKDATGAWTAFSGAPLARARAMWQIGADGRLVPVYQVEAGVEGGEYARLLVDGRTGEVISRASLTSHATYRVWVDDDGRPADSPLQDMSPTAAGPSDQVERTYLLPSVVEVDGLNTNPERDSDPWLSDGATTLSGNNAFVYTDRVAPEGLSEGDAMVSTDTPGVFDAEYDFSAEPTASDSQALASGTHAFYVLNWMHDLYYDAGFDEAEGVAQVSNYGRGGVEGDPIEVRLQAGWDAGQRSNANMTVPDDGASPILNLYVWVPESEVYVDGVEGVLAGGSAGFGPTNVEVSAEAAWVNAPGTGCSAADDAVAGRIAVALRGGCDYHEKAEAAEAAGAVGLIVVNYESSDEAVSMAWSEPTGEIGIPTVSLSFTDASALMAALDAGQNPMATLVRGPDRDCGLDATIVAHEWGHYLMARSTYYDGVEDQAMSEGWSDMTSLHLMLREGDDLDGAYAFGAYVTPGQGWAYAGQRRQPYSRDRAVNGLSYRHVMEAEPLPTSTDANEAPNTEEHNAGEVWASVLFDTYLALHEASPGEFDAVQLRWAEMTLVALSLLPDMPTWLEGRDAWLATGALYGPEEAQIIAEAFAGRGLGVCATSGPDFTRVVEDGGLHPDPSAGAPWIEEEACDGDGFLDAGESATLVFPVENLGYGELTGAVLTVSSDAAGLTFPDGASAEIASTPALEAAEVRIRVALAEGVEGPATLELGVEIASDSCDGSWNDTARLLIHADVQDGSATDTFTKTDWSADDAWRLASAEWDTDVWSAASPEATSDGRVVSPPMIPADGERFTLSFTHAHDLEEVVGRARDAGVVELRVDGGAWEDASSWVDVPYTGTVNSDTSTLDGLPAFIGQNASWPNPDVVTLDLGTDLAGHSVEVAFRSVTDATGAGTGWQIGDVTVTGVRTPPFSAVSSDPQACAAGEPEEKDTCGCATSAPLPSVISLGFLAALLRRRRNHAFRLPRALPGQLATNLTTHPR